MMKLSLKLLRGGLLALCGILLAGLLTVAGAYVYLAPHLPSIETLKDVHFQEPLRVYTSDARLMAEFGEMKRTPLKYREIPETMIHAILAAEDDRFFEHPGVDYQGILRAALNLVRTGEKTQGGSTITMQVARNFFLSRRKTYLRKLNEIFLALKIEHELSKEEILELYLNKIYLGNRAYGIAAAAQIYYGSSISDLDIAQIATIAGLPKAPSRYNPIANAERAQVRRDYVLGRMHELGYIDDIQYQGALAEPEKAQLHRLDIEVTAPYVAEMVRSVMLERYGNQAYTEGFRVFTTLDPHLQAAANKAVRKALLDYDRRHGYRGVEQHIDISQYHEPGQMRHILGGKAGIGDLLPAVVIKLENMTATAMLPDNSLIKISREGLAWARPYIDENHRGVPPERASDFLQTGDIIRVQQLPGGAWRLAQAPSAEGALVALRPDSGRIVALSGGFDFYRSKFNRVTQAKRQPGSSFKPFIYSAAIAKGYTAASIINDAPVVFQDPGLESAWRPENYSGKFYGPTRLREALVKSRNLVSIRLLRSIGINYTIDYVSRFGFRPDNLPKNLSLALGSGAVSPLALATGYAVFANGGFRITPFFIERIEGPRGEIVMQATPATVCPDCQRTGNDDHEIHAPPAGVTAVASRPQQRPDTPPAINLATRVITPENAYLMTSMMRDVIRRGTGRRARSLGRHDLAGKTGTTNDQRDAWFAGFNADITAVSWVGFDKARSLGNRETGARAALPIWTAFMKEALSGVAEKPLVRPPGLITVRIDPQSGLLANTHQPHALFETFRTKFVPKRHAETPSATNRGMKRIPPIPEQLF